MPILAEVVDVVIGVDTHKHTHTAAAVAAGTGGVSDQLTVTADADGYQQLLELAQRHDGLRVWSIEGTGSYGAGLTRFLVEQGESVVEVERPNRPVRRHGAKSDPLDAVRAARGVLVSLPRCDGHLV